MTPLLLRLGSFPTAHEKRALAGAPTRINLAKRPDQLFNRHIRHCEERSDEAIQGVVQRMVWIASLRLL